MNIVDSSCWIEYLMDTETGAAVASVIENPDELIVPTIILYEVFKKLLAVKGEEYASNVVSYMQTGTVIDLNAGLSLSSAQISRKHKLPAADSIIYATNMNFSSILWTQDKHFMGLESVNYLEK